MLAGAGVVGGTYYVDGVPTPNELDLPEATTVFYSDGKTVMARLGEENRTILAPEDMNDAVKEAIVASEDSTFWTNKGVDFNGVLRAAWNNFTGGQTQGASTLTQQYARMAMDLQGATYSRKLREAVIAWKLDDKYSKSDILGFYLNTVPFGRGTHGIEAATQAFFGKTANRKAPAAQQITVSEAMLLVAMVKQPEPDPDDPDNYPGYDPTRPTTDKGKAKALELAQGRWSYVRGQMIKLKYLNESEAAQLTFPAQDLVPYATFQKTAGQADLAKPTGLVVQHALAELRASQNFKGRPKGYIENGGFQIITTVNKLAEDAAIRAGDITQKAAPAADQGQDKDWQAALVSVQPGTGRVLAFFGGANGAGSDYAGWYYDEDGTPTGYGAHPAGSTFKVYDLVTALRQGISLQSYWDAPRAPKAFPEAGRGPDHPIRNASTAKCQPTCTLSDAAVASLNIPFFDLTIHLGAANVLETARDAGVDFMWDGDGKRQDLSAAPSMSPDMVPHHFGNELGIGQYPITVVDHANGMATMAYGGKRSDVHFVMTVKQDGNTVYSEKLGVTKDLHLTPEQVADLDATLVKVSAGHFSDTWQTAAKTGTWEWRAADPDKNSHVWTTGYTKAMATAVWVGTKSGKALHSRQAGYAVYGNNFAGPIFQQYMRDATQALFPHPDASMLHFDGAANTGNLMPNGAVASPTPSFVPPTQNPTPPNPDPTPTNSPTATVTPSLPTLPGRHTPSPKP